MEAAGAGEILLTSMDRDGTQDGYDLAADARGRRRVDIPVIASGGAGTLEHLHEGLTRGRRQRGAGGVDLPLRRRTRRRGEGVPRVARRLHPAGRRRRVTGGWLADTAALYGRVFRRAGAADRAQLAAGVARRSATRCCSRRCRLCSAPFGFVGGMLLDGRRRGLLQLVALLPGAGRSRPWRGRSARAAGELRRLPRRPAERRLPALSPAARGRVRARPVSAAAHRLRARGRSPSSTPCPSWSISDATGAAELLAESYRFIGENWIEWFPANLLLVAAVLAVDMVLPDGPLGLISAAGAGLVAAYGCGRARAALPRADDVEPARARVSPARGGVGAPLRRAALRASARRRSPPCSRVPAAVTAWR